jgi:hypothetical protein
VSEKTYTLQFPDGTEKVVSTAAQIKAEIKSYLIAVIHESITFPTVSVTSDKSGKLIDVTASLADIRYKLDHDINDFVKADVYSQSYKPQTLSPACNRLIQIAKKSAESLFYVDEKLAQLKHAGYITQIKGDKRRLDSYEVAPKGKQYLSLIKDLPGSRLPLNPSTLFRVLRLMCDDSTLSDFLRYETKQDVVVWDYVGVLNSGPPANPPINLPSKAGIFLTDRGGEALNRYITKSVMSEMRYPRKDASDSIRAENNRVNRLIIRLVPKNEISILLSAPPAHSKYFRFLLDL